MLLTTRPILLSLLCAAALSLLCAAAVSAADGAQAEVVIRLSDGKRPHVVVTGLTGRQLQRLRRAELDTAAWSRLLPVTVVGDRPGTDAGGTANAEAGDLPPMLGTYHVTGNGLLFQPRFPLRAGVRYRAVLHLRRMPGGDPAAASVSQQLALPESPAGPPARLAAIYPSHDVLPENQLKFYLHFSAPMSRGEAYQRVRLLGDDGRPVEFPFLELGQELWDPAGRRFTLFFDPGRIKRGLKPRELFGPALEEGRSYTLEVDRGWLDAAGRPLERTVRKRFRVVAPDDTQPDPARWGLSLPQPGTREPLVVDFGEPLDQAMLMRVLHVADAEGKLVPGRITLGRHETQWRWEPERPWRAGGYAVVADTALEDLAGNSIGRPFEVDLFEKVQRRVQRETVRVPFQVGAPRPAGQTR